MNTFNREKFLDGILKYVNRTLPVSETMPNDVCERLNNFLRSSDLNSGAGILDEMYVEYCPEYERGKSLWELSRYGEDCSDEDRTILRETAVAFGRYFKDGEDVLQNEGESLRGIYLHRHQSESVEAYRRGKNVLVCTGTGSGKTECFLIPIIDKLLRERKRQTIDEYNNVEHRHVHAMIMYPMNALVNDQIKRLRQIISYIDFTGNLEGKPITFGWYTGDLKRQSDVEDGTTEAITACATLPRPDQGLDQNLGYIQNQGGLDVSHPIPSEYITREQWITEGPADILVTNNSMMEQLLIRPNRSRIFQGGNWDFIVLDEAHSYTGSTGTEIAWQMRRLERRLRSYINENEYKLPQCFATSATLVNGDAEAQEAAAIGFMRGLFPIGGGDVFVGVDHLVSPEIAENQLVDGVPLTNDIECLVEDSAKLEAQLTNQAKLRNLQEYLDTIRNNGGRVSVSDALWLATNPTLRNVNICYEANGWIEYFVKLVVTYSITAFGDREALWNFWRDTLHNYDSKEFSPDGKFLGNRLGYLNDWTDIFNNGVNVDSISGEEFSYLMLAVQVVLEKFGQSGQNLGTFYFSRIQVSIQFEDNILKEDQQLPNQAQEIIERWNNLLGVEIPVEEFSMERRFSYKDRIAQYLLTRRDMFTVISMMSENRFMKMRDLIGGGSNLETEQELSCLLQLAGFAKLSGHRKPLMDVKCHQAFRGISNIGVWFDDNGEYHFTRSEEEYTDGDEQTRRKIFSLGICRECGQLYLLGYTSQEAISQDGDVLWRNSVGDVSWLHAVALPFGAADNQLPYDNEKIQVSDDRDRPMSRLEQNKNGSNKWSGWINKGVAIIASHSIDFKSGNVLPRDINELQPVFWCLNAVEQEDDNDGTGQSFIPRCPCCGTSQRRLNGAKYGIITPYEAYSDQFVVSSLESFAHASVDDGNESEAKVLAFSDSRQGASSLALNFEIASARTFAETVIRVSIGKYNAAVNDLNSELGRIVSVPRHPDKLAEVQKELLENIGGGNQNRINELITEIANLKADAIIAPLTVRNIVDWGLMDSDMSIPGVYDIDRVDANGRHSWMRLKDAQKFVVMSTLVDPSSRSRTGVVFYSKTISEMNLNFNNYDTTNLKKCLQRIYRQLVKHCVIENSGNDYELRDGNRVFNNQGEPGSGYETIDDFCGSEQGQRRGREYVHDAIVRFFPELQADRPSRVNLARYFWNRLCDGRVLTALENYADYYKLDYNQLCDDMLLELDEHADVPNVARYPFTIQEHTAQISGLRGAFYQQRFAAGKINVLSCSTTFEMGIDVGGLNNVFLSNLPPNTANYKQRAGRAGRRPGALAQVVTYVRDADWREAPLRKMLNGAVIPPMIYLENPVYKYRHLRAEALRFFLAHVEERHPTILKGNGQLVELKWNHFGSFLIGFRYTWRMQNGQRVYVRVEESRIKDSVVEQCVGSWLSEDNGGFSARTCDQYISNITDVTAGEPEMDLNAMGNRPSLDLIFQLVGDKLLSNFPEGCEHWTVCMQRKCEDYYIRRGGCYMPLPVEDGNPANDVTFRWPGREDSMRLPLRDRKLLMMRRMAEINDVTDGDWLSDQIGDYMLHTECPPMQRRLLNENTISALSACGIIPKYGFPIDVIELLVDGRGARDVDLKRDLAIGLYEYAPGQVVIANKHEFNVYPDRRGVLFNNVSYAQLNEAADGNGLVAWLCRNCRSIHDDQINNCPDCNSIDIMPVAIVRPDAFKAKDKGRRHGFVRKNSKGQRIVRLPSCTRGNAFRVRDTFLHVMFDANRSIAYYNANLGSGFDLRSDNAAENDILRYALLTHNIHTDVVIWKLDRSLFDVGGSLNVLLPKNNADAGGLSYAQKRFRNAMASALEAVRIAASRCLQIPDRELGAFVYPNGNSFWWVIYDAAQGGGGNVLPLAKKQAEDMRADEIITAVLREALEIVSGCTCLANDIENHPMDSEYVRNRIPIPISVYRSLNDYHIYNHGPNPAETYRVSRACSNCIAPRYSWKKDDVFDCVDAALVLSAILEGGLGEDFENGRQLNIINDVTRDWDWVAFSGRLRVNQWYKKTTGEEFQYKTGMNIDRFEIKFERG
jgi:hypothetical protein